MYYRPGLVALDLIMSSHLEMTNIIMTRPENHRHHPHHYKKLSWRQLEQFFFADPKNNIVNACFARKYSRSPLQGLPIGGGRVGVAEGKLRAETFLLIRI